MKTGFKFFLSVLLYLLVCQTYSIQRYYITGNEFKKCADYIVENHVAHFNPKNVQEKSIIFVDAYSLPYFFKQIFPLIENSFFLITHNGDGSAPGEFVKFLNDPRIIMWFGQNCDVIHPKFFPIPIGIANSHWPHGDTRIFDTVLDSLEMNLSNKIHKLYVNFGLTTDIYRSKHNTVPSCYDAVPFRKKLYEQLREKSFVFIPAQNLMEHFQKPIKEFLIELSQYLFVLSPFGGGLDCLRTWEALLVGSIPIVYSSTLNPLYEDLPVIIVTSWDEITEEFLEMKYQEIKAKKYNKEKLFMNYWRDMIKEYKNFN